MTLQEFRQRGPLDRASTNITPMTRKTTVLRSLLFLLVCPVPLVVSGSLVKTTSSVGMIEVGTFTSILTFLLTLLFLRWDHRDFRDVGLGMTIRTLPRWVVGFLIGSALVALQEFIIYAGGHTHWALDLRNASTASVLLSLAAYVMLALREELAFRAYPLRSLERASGMWAALLVTGIVFMLEHNAGGWTWSRSLLGPPAGALLFGMAALATRGIAVPFGIHAAFNFGQWVMGQKENVGLWRPMIDAGFKEQAEALGYLGYLLGALGTAFAFWLWQRGQRPRPSR
jgi:uncharacterized protein